MQEQEQEHKRRVRYSGRYPRKFEENIRNYSRKNMLRKSKKLRQRAKLRQERISRSWWVKY